MGAVLLKERIRLGVVVERAVARRPTMGRKSALLIISTAVPQCAAMLGSNWLGEWWWLTLGVEVELEDPGKKVEARRTASMERAHRGEE